MSSHVAVKGVSNNLFVYNLIDHTVLEIGIIRHQIPQVFKPIQTWPKESTVATLVAQFITAHLTGDQ